MKPAWKQLSIVKWWCDGYKIVNGRERSVETFENFQEAGRALIEKKFKLMKSATNEVGFYPDQLYSGVFDQAMDGLKGA